MMTPYPVGKNGHLVGENRLFKTQPKIKIRKLIKEDRHFKSPFDPFEAEYHS